MPSAPSPDLTDVELEMLAREAATREGTFWETMRRLIAEVVRRRAGP